MNTTIIKVDEDIIEEDDLEEAIRVLKSGGLVAFPTETVYGLGANGLDEEAARKIYTAKGRPSDNPLILHIADMKSLEDIAINIPEAAKKLAKEFWPGPLTMILQKGDKVPLGTTGGLNTVAVRMPVHKIALELIRKSGLYIAAPSANTSGKPSPTKASHVYDDLSGKIDMIIDGGKVGIGLESTIVDLTTEIPTILRPGYITKSMLEEVVGEVEVDKAVLSKNKNKNLVPKAPGMKYKHYAPKGDLTIFAGPVDLVIDEINKRAKSLVESDQKVGIIATDETKDAYHYGTVKTIGTRSDDETIASGLYEVLRDFDDLEVQYIFSESFLDDDLGQAIMNRLLKAAGYDVVHLG